MKPGKHQRRNQRCQDLYLTVNDRAQSYFHAFSYAMKTFLLAGSSVRSTVIVFCVWLWPKIENKHTTRSFITIAPLLTMNARNELPFLNSYVLWHSLPGSAEGIVN